MIPYDFGRDLVSLLLGLCWAVYSWRSLHLGVDLVTLRGTGVVRNMALHELLRVSRWCLSEFTPDKIENERLRKTLHTFGYHITSLKAFAHTTRTVSLTLIRIFTLTLPITLTLT